MRIIDRNPWLLDLPPAAAWAFVRFYHFAEPKKPAGTVRDVKPATWAKRLGVQEGDVAVMLAAAIRANAIRADGRGRWIIADLADPQRLAESTPRVRKHRARSRGDQPSADPAQPAFTPSDAIVVIRAMYGRVPSRLPAALKPAIVRALYLLHADTLKWTGGPVKALASAVDEYPNLKVKINAVDFLGNTVARMLGRVVDLTAEPPVDEAVD